MKLTCVVDNTVRLQGLWGEHGLAMVLDVGGQRLLYDTSATEAVLLHNLARLNIDVAGLNLVVLSHGHQDHTGGLAALLRQCPELPVWAHPAVVERRYGERERVRHMNGPELGVFALQGGLGQAHYSTEPAEILPGVWTVGQIHSRAYPEGRGKGHAVQRDGRWLDDPYDDDLSLLAFGAQGPALICGCCHAGLLNTLARAREFFGLWPQTIIGGTHLMSASPAQLAQVTALLAEMGTPRFHLNHCTGTPALIALAAAFPGRVATFAAGDTLEL
jgi:7,8-dihydropterin-6-yl-methyl-4-(beta-D-ribofuranosyl)aminobenzene 5'-phosphate synthase